jgi:hypothetical protein
MIANTKYRYGYMPNSGMGPVSSNLTYLNPVGDQSLAKYGTGFLNLSSSNKNKLRVSPSYASAPVPTAEISTPVLSPYEKLTQEYQNTYNTAKAANEQRYQDILSQYGILHSDVVGGYQNRLTETMKMLEGLGSQESADIEQDWINKESKAKQDLISRGFANTTVAPTMSMGYTRGKQADLARLNERLQNQRLGVYGQLSGDVLSAQQDITKNKLDFMERREDTYPDMNMYAQLAQLAGMAGLTTPTASTSTAPKIAAVQPYQRVKVKSSGKHYSVGGRLKR